jgi:CubicO group peptidase (beta-lactamase class C family)
MATPLWGAVRQDKLEAAADVLAKSTASGQMHAAAMCVRQGTSEFARAFGAAKKADDLFLIASISKPMSIAAVMTLYDRGEFQLDDPVRKFIPEFTGEGRENITIRQLMTHVSGLPDQLPQNNSLRSRHAELPEFVKGAVRTPLLFEPGARYEYSSMGILLASEIAQRISGKDFRDFIDEAVFRPLGMHRSALGLGRFQLEDLVRCQVENAAPESGAGDAAAKDWDWNSRYWRGLGSPWGGVHASASDVARFFAEFLHPAGAMLKPETARLAIENHNRAGLPPRGLGFAVGAGSGSRGCSEKTFGHTGATGTLAWADPETDTVCVVLTTLPGRGVNPHPRNVAADLVAAAMR